MKKLTLFVAISTFSFTVFADPKPKTWSHAPRTYIMMKQGKLIEVNNGHRKLVKKDITLANETTIHPNGAIDASSGQSLQLKEGEFMTMDGRIRSLKVLPHSHSGK